MSLLTPQLLPAVANSKQIPARRMTLERKVFMSEPLFYISVTILLLDLLVCHRILLPPPCAVPASHADEHCPLFAGSHVMDDIQNAGGDLWELDRQGFRHGYGRYLGKDGKVHLGIEREPCHAFDENPHCGYIVGLFGVSGYTREPNGAQTGRTSYSLLKSAKMTQWPTFNRTNI